MRISAELTKLIVEYLRETAITLRAQETHLARRAINQPLTRPRAAGRNTVPQTESELNQMNNAINRALAGLNDTAATDKQHSSNPTPSATSPAVAPSQLPIDDDARKAMARDIRRISGGSK